MGSGQGRLKDKNADGRGDGSSSSAHNRKFQSYHLPFQKKKKFAKLKARLFGPKKPKPESVHGTSKTSAGGRANFFLGQELNKSSGVSASLQVLSTSAGPRPNVLSSAHSQHVFAGRSDSPETIRSESERREAPSGDRFEKIELTMPLPEFRRADSLTVERDASNPSLRDEIALFKKNEDPYSIVVKEKRKTSEVVTASKRESSSSNSIFEDATEGDLPREIAAETTNGEAKPDGESSQALVPSEPSFEDAVDDAPENELPDEPNVEPVADALSSIERRCEPPETALLPTAAEEESGDSFCDLNGFEASVNDGVKLLEEPSRTKIKQPEAVTDGGENANAVCDDDRPRSGVIAIDATILKPAKSTEDVNACSHVPDNRDSPPPRFSLPKGRRPKSISLRVAKKRRESDSSDERSGSVGDDGRAFYSSESDMASDPSSTVDRPDKVASNGEDPKKRPPDDRLVEDVDVSKGDEDGPDRTKAESKDGSSVGPTETMVVVHPPVVDEASFVEGDRARTSVDDRNAVFEREFNSGDERVLPPFENPPRHAFEEISGSDQINAIPETDGEERLTEHLKLDSEAADRSAAEENGVQNAVEVFKTDARGIVLPEESRRTEDFLGISSDVDFAERKKIVRRSGNYDASDSSSGEQKASVSMASSEGSGSDIADDIWEEDFENEKSAEAIKTKLVLDLLKRLEVDMGDFRTFTELPGVLEDKYHVLPLREFLTANLESKFSLDDLSRCLRVLAKYGLNLLKAGGEEEQHWRKVIIPPKMLLGHWLSVQGSKDILMALGYEESDRDLVYPEGEEPNVETTAAWVVEMLLAAHEINVYCMGSHPQPEMFKGLMETKGSEASTPVVSDAAEEPSSGDRPQSEDDAKHPVDNLDFKKEEEEVQSAAAFFTPCVPDDEDGDVRSISATEEKEGEKIEETEPRNKEDVIASEMFGRRTVVPWLMDKERRLPEAPPQQRCHLCGSSSPAVRCEKCSNLIFCVSCDDMYHRHPKRRDHTRKAVNVALTMPPPLPPPRPPSKLTDPNKIPVPPPRRRKSQRSIHDSPVFGRKATEQKPELPKKQFPNLKFGSLKRFIPGANVNRPPPSSPKEQYPTGSDHRDRSNNVGGLFIDAKYGVGQGQVQENTRDFSNREPSTNFPRDGNFLRFPGKLKAPEQSSSDAEEDFSAPCDASRGSGGSFAGSGARDEQWSPSSPGPPLPPPYGGTTSRSVASLHQLGSYPEMGYGNSTLSRRNTMMMGPSERSLGYGYPRVNFMQHSSSVCDLSNPMMPPPYVMGYRLPHVQSMADLQQGEIMGPLAAPCGCRPNWIGPDAFGQWHPPVACLAHGANANAFASGAKPQQSPFHQGFAPVEGMFGTLPHPVVYPMMTASGSPVGYPPASPLPPADPRGIRGPSGTGEQRATSPAASAASAGSRKKSKEVRGHSRTARRRTRPPMGTTSSEEDYFSAGASDEDEPLEHVRNKIARHYKLANGSWECEHCTFINKADTRICNVCCKTPGHVKGEKRGINRKNSNAVVDMEVDAEEIEVEAEDVSGRRLARVEEKLNKFSRKTPPKQDDGEYEDLDDGRTNRTKSENEKVIAKVVPVEQKNTVSRSSKQKSGVNASNSPVRHGVEVATDPMEIEDDSTVNCVQSDTQTYSSVFRDKILPASSSSSKTNGSTMGQKNVMSKGTSPPPQSIATQTPHADVWTSPEPPQKSLGRTSSRMSLSGDASEPVGGGAYHPPSSALKRATSLHFPRSYGGGYNDGGGSNWGIGYHGSSLVRSGSRSSLMSDQHFGYNLSGPPSRDSSPPPPVQHNVISRRESNIERGQVVYSGFSQEERNMRNESRKDYYLSLEELVEKRRLETLRTQGLELVKLLREAEQQNFSADDLQVAMNHCGSQNPVQWLQDNWKNMVDTVVTLATNYGNDKKKNDIGVMSSSEAKESLRLHKGNIWAAVTECVEQRQKRFADLQSRGNFSRDEIVAALTSNQGNVELAFEELNKASLKPFLMRIWGPPSGAENESGITWAAMQAIRRERDADSAKDKWKDSLPLDDYEASYLSTNNYIEGEVGPNEAEWVSNEGESGLEEMLDSVPDGDSLDDDAELPEGAAEKSEAKDEEFFDAFPGTPSEEQQELENPFDFVKERSEIPSPREEENVSRSAPEEHSSLPRSSPGASLGRSSGIPRSEEDSSLPRQSPPVALFQSSVILKSSATITLERPSSPSPIRTPSRYVPESVPNATLVSAMRIDLEPVVKQCQHAATPMPLQETSGSDNVDETEAVLARVSNDQTLLANETPTTGDNLGSAEPEIVPRGDGGRAEAEESTPVVEEVEPARGEPIRQSPLREDVTTSSVNGEASELKRAVDVDSSKVEVAPIRQSPLPVVDVMTPNVNDDASDLKCGADVVSSNARVAPVRQSPLREDATTSSVNDHALDVKRAANVDSSQAPLPMPESGQKESASVRHPAKARLKKAKVVDDATSKNDVGKAKPVANVSESDFSRRIRQFLAEGKLPTYERAEVAIKLIDLRFDETEAIYAARECSDLYMAVSYLQQDCEICAGKFPMGKMISMLNCIHRCCRNCAKDYFTLKIKERNVMEIVCPFCNEPNLNDDDIAVDYFNNLDIVLKNLVDEDAHELFQRKLRDRALMSDPNFLWCNKCAFGFMAEPNRRRLVCPNCKVITCAECKKQWEKQHDGISCQQFLEWKQDNDPEYQMAGLEKYLAENGIDCPKCKFKYALAKGGCMHFTCSQCKFEFCSGCGRPFKMAKKCGVSQRCERLGLHAHHPRNCLFYLRDKEPKDLLKLLDDHGVSHGIDVRCTEEEDEGQTRQCPVIEQKELPDGVQDSKCGREVEADHPGLCRLHYVEYLVSLINNNALDPVTIMDIGGLQQELRRKEKLCPDREDGEPEEQYRNKLVQFILKEIPLEDA